MSELAEQEEVRRFMNLIERCYTGLEAPPGALMLNPRLPEEVMRLEMSEAEPVSRLWGVRRGSDPDAARGGAMIIANFEVEGWEREAFSDLERDHEVVFRDDDTSHQNIAAFVRGEAVTILGRGG